MKGNATPTYLTFNIDEVEADVWLPTLSRRFNGAREPPPSDASLVRGEELLLRELLTRFLPVRIDILLPIVAYFLFIRVKRDASGPPWELWCTSSGALVSAFSDALV